MGRTQIVGDLRKYTTSWVFLKLPFLVKRKLKPGDTTYIQDSIIIRFELVFLVPCTCFFSHLVSNFISFCSETYTLFLGHTEFYIIYQHNSRVGDLVYDIISAGAFSSFYSTKHSFLFFFPPENSRLLKTLFVSPRGRVGSPPSMLSGVLCCLTVFIPLHFSCV